MLWHLCISQEVNKFQCKKYVCLNSIGKFSRESIFLKVQLEKNSAKLLFYQFLDPKYGKENSAKLLFYQFLDPKHGKGVQRTDITNRQALMAGRELKFTHRFGGGRVEMTFDVKLQPTE
jgi:hypothetical protein